MPYRNDQVFGQLAFGDPAAPPAPVRRALRRGPRLRMTTPPRTRNAAGQAPRERVLAEWHQMTPGEQHSAWATLRAWVTWLHDRYELAVEERLPRCWPDHPGLIEELSALRAWREEIYAADQPSGQAARYWHAELRQVIHAATTIYAAGCRTGHRPAPAPVAEDHALQQRWAAADPHHGIPAADLAAARHPSRQLSHAEMTEALDTGQARPAGPAMPDLISYTGGLWTPVSGGWLQVTARPPAAVGPAAPPARAHSTHLTGGDGTS